MADDDSRSDVLKGLGVKRRRSADAGPADDDEAKASGSGLGIKRRTGSGSGRAPAEKGGGPGLGIKRRTGASADGGGGAADTGDEAEAAAVDPAVADPLHAWRSKFGNDGTSIMLSNHFRHRPELPGMLPARSWELERTNGRYSGDGRPEREIKIGWKPAMVMFMVPGYPDGIPEYDKQWQVIEPGLHRQPEFTDEGFKITSKFNVMGDWYTYIVWKSDGEPLELPEPEPDKRAKAKAKSKEGGRGLNLGIKRRK